MKVKMIMGDHDTASVEIKLSELKALVKLAETSSNYITEKEICFAVNLMLFQAEHGNRGCQVIGCHDPAIYVEDRYPYRVYCSEHR